MTRVVVGPFNRVEGDLEVTLDVEGGRVKEARVTASMYRGFENLLAGRPALDALVMVPRICGICSVSQSAAAVAALADLSRAAMPRNGRLAANTILATEVLLDHLSHFYLFFMPDFARADYANESWHAESQARFGAMKGSAAVDFLPARARFLTVIGLLAGKWPHTLALRPGGTTRPVASGEQVRLLALVREMRGFLERHFFGDRIENVLALDDPAALRRWAAGRTADWPRFLVLADRLGLEAVGRADAVLLAAGAYPDAEGGEPGFAGGVFDRKLKVVPGKAGAAEVALAPSGSGPSNLRPRAPIDPLDPARIVEDTHAAWYADSVSAPALGQTRPQAGKAGAYSWCKAPRYGGRPVETGAFARQWLDGQLLVRAAAPEGVGNVTARVLARGMEVARLLPAIESWIKALRETEPFHAETELPTAGEGVGFVEAARGTLGHWLRLDDGKIAHYQIVAPTTWNFSPRDATGVSGALEQALVGLPMREDGRPSALIQHVVRSFDPCLACTVH